MALPGSLRRFSRQPDSLRRPPRPVAEDMRHVRIRNIRSRVDIGQESLPLRDGSTLSLHWTARTAGTFGPLSSLEANHMRQHARKTLSAGAAHSASADRGKSVAWHLSMVCSECKRTSCRDLYSPKGPLPIWKCTKCWNLTWRSRNRSGSKAGSPLPQTTIRQRHIAAARRIVEQKMKLSWNDDLTLCWNSLAKPRWMRRDKWINLLSQLDAHLTLSWLPALAAIDKLEQSLGIQSEAQERIMKLMEKAEACLSSSLEDDAVFNWEEELSLIDRATSIRSFDGSVIGLSREDVLRHAVVI